MVDPLSILVFSEKPSLLAELIAGANSLVQSGGGQVSAAVLGPRSEAEQAAGRGAARVFWLGESKESYLIDDYVPTLARLIEENRPNIVLIGATMRGKAIAGRLAAHFGSTVITDVKQFQPENGHLVARHMIFGGGAERLEKPLSEPVFATVASGVFEARPVESGLSGEVIEAEFVEPKWRVGLKERKQRPTSSVNLAAARKVVCPGRGIQKKEDLGMVNELAQMLGAEIGCTRPLAEGLDWLPRERYIGISGAVIRPDLYLGVGVSGQVQHMVGMGDSRVVVAINKDSNAPIFSQADYGIVGDLYTIVPMLIQALKDRK